MTSHHGQVCAISIANGKILDTHVMTNHCVQCSQWDKKDQDSEAYINFYADHFPDCQKNHDGSAASMEAAGSVEIYENSVETRNLRYNPYVGDGDSKAFRAVQTAQPYGDTYNITKEECIGYAQKKLGTRLRNLVNKKKGIKLSDGKPLGGLGGH